MGVALQTGKKNPVEFVKTFRFVIRDTFGMERAAGDRRRCAGRRSGAGFHGIKKRKKQLYLLGELLDVDGICGGYNLHFAWSTAMIAAKHIFAVEEGE